VANLFIFIFLKSKKLSKILKIIIRAFSLSEIKSPSCEKSQKTGKKKALMTRLVLS
jgi:hypothetical protein